MRRSGTFGRPRRPRPTGRTSRSVLIAHPGAELYGSDRVMLETVTGLVDGGWTVVVTLPVAGPLIVEVERRGGRVVLCRAPVLRKSALRPQGFLRLMADAVLGLAPAISLIRSTHCDLVFVNTITIPGWLLLGRLLGRATVCHVHEAEGSAPLPLRRVMTLPVLAAHRILVNSRFSRAVLVASIPRIARRKRSSTTRWPDLRW